VKGFGGLGRVERIDLIDGPLYAVRVGARVRVVCVSNRYLALLGDSAVSMTTGRFFLFVMGGIVRSGDIDHNYLPPRCLL
jgi:hypothetical protein